MSRKYFYSYIFFFLKLFTFCFSQKDCTILRDFYLAKVPFIFFPETKSYFKGNIKDQLDIPHKTSLVVDCHNSLIDLKYTTDQKKSITVTCMEGKFYYNRNAIVLDSIFCLENIEPTFTKIKFKCCSEEVNEIGLNSTEQYLIQIGFNISGIFITQIILCADLRVTHTCWSYHYMEERYRIKKLGKSMKFKPDRPLKIECVFLNLSTREIFISKYKLESQISTLNSTLLTNNKIYVKGSEKDIIIYKTNQFFSRGHLVATSDFLLHAERQGTNFFLNTVPQWSKFNCENWGSLERLTRYWIKMRSLNLDVYSGSYGIITYPNNMRTQIKFYMDHESQRLPVPLFLWKVLYDAKKHSGLAYIGINDPHYHISLEHICLSKCDQTLIRGKKFEDLTHGRIICCEIVVARQFIKAIPDLTKDGQPPSILLKKNTKK